MKMLKNIIIIIGIISSFAFIAGMRESSIEYKFITKLIPTVCLSAYMLISRVSKRNVFVFIGLLFSMLCDFFMEFNSQLTISLGIFSSLMGLSFYLFYFLRFSKELKLDYLWPPLVMITIMYLILYQNLGSLKIPVLLYCTFFVLLMWRANIVKDIIENRMGLYLFWSTLSLILSDSLLSLTLFDIINSSILFNSVYMLLWWGGLFGLAIFSTKKKNIQEIK